MTSEERHTARRARREERRLRKKKDKCARYDNFDEVFSYENLYNSYKHCRKGVAWKSSVQSYISNAPLNVLNTHERLMNGTFKSRGFYEFDVSHRGKMRHIQSAGITDRVVYRCLCDNSLTQMISRPFIYDNGASLQFKGYDFAIRRITCHLHRHYRKYGRDGYILLFDFSKFFANISHELVKGIVEEQYSDARLISLVSQFVDDFGDTGLALGSHISHVLALASADKLDHHIKEVLRIKNYGRYMDDGYLIHPSKEYLVHCLSSIARICDTLGITLNMKKTRIAKLSHGFTWIKARFYLTETGRVVRKVDRGGITHMRVKLKKLRKMLDDGRVDASAAYMSFQSWRAHAKRFDAYRTIKSMERLYDKLFIDEMEVCEHALY